MVFETTKGEDRFIRFFVYAQINEHTIRNLAKGLPQSHFLRGKGLLRNCSAPLVCILYKRHPHILLNT